MPSDRQGPSALHIISPCAGKPNEWGDNREVTESLDLAIARAWRKGCFKGKLPDALKTFNTWDDYMGFIQWRWDLLTHHLYDAHGITKTGERTTSDLLYRFSDTELQRASQLG
ncbi:hypothetical protein BDV29DRAFT_115460 [Aspergillus leporis]|jgi:hypothetical protein|uniref:Uncharacterized protein n=1 Tax=Aspergillus leporis TaxID=41062 RepID=A0A5N5X6G0_9EURO|nr:hypothetical protein BDV29DRAFT_115460 [Aspergillus leporis]